MLLGVPSAALAVIDYAALFLARAIIGAMYYLPERYGILIARCCIRVLRLAMPRLSAVGRRNLELVFPASTPFQRERILYESYETLARNLLSYARIPLLTTENAATRVDFTAAKLLIDRVRSEHPGVGLILPTLHFGSFELLVQLQALCDRPISFLARGFGLERLDAWWNVRREMFGNKVFGRKGGYQEMVNCLRSGRDVGMLFDQNVKSNHAVFVDFFGIKAATTKALALASVRTGAPIIFAASIDLLNGKLELVCEQVPTFENEGLDLDARVERITRALNEQVEKLIRRRPEQWFWVHRRFKTRPSGEAENIYEGI